MKNKLAQYEENAQWRDSPIWTAIFITVVVLSNFSQLPALVSVNATSLLSTPVWLILGVLLLINTRLILQISSTAMSFLKWCFVFIFLVVILNIFTSGSQLSGSLFRVFIISLMVFSIGCVSSEFISLVTIDKMELAYILSMVVVGVNIYFQYLVGYDISSIAYGYTSKNSVSTMLLAAVVFLVFGLNELPSIKKRFFLRCIAVAFFIILMGIMKSRASLIGLTVVLIAVFLSPKVRRWQKAIIIVVSIVGVVYVMYTPTAYDLIINDILYAGRDANSISSLSSGRSDLIVNTLDLLSEKPFVGIGSYYIDCFPVSAWANYGYIIGTILIFISVYPLVSSMRNLKSDLNTYNLCYTVMVLAAAFSLNSLFEGLPPFGPGIKCYIVWFLFGVLCNYYNEGNNEE